jgi:branched-subunit amino acid transport protein AzlD
MSDGYVLWAILAMGAVTFLIRALPFLGARWLRGSPVVRRIGLFLPPAIMALLLTHSVRDFGMQAPAQWWPAIVAMIVTLALQFYRRQPLLSIAAGTITYMLWIQLAGP